MLQITSGLRLTRVVRWPPSIRDWVRPAHHICGVVAVVLTLPVAFDCLRSFAFLTTSPRVELHSFFGCAFYGAFVTKLIVVRAPRRIPKTLVSVVEGVVFALLISLWVTSSLWFLTRY